VPKVQITVTLDRTVARAVRAKAARTAKTQSEVIEAALRRDLGLDLLARMWASTDLGEDEALRLAVEAQHESRRGQR
jgi:Ribbon-helix-helix protein, copG family